MERHTSCFGRQMHYRKTYDANCDSELWRRWLLRSTSSLQTAVQVRLSGRWLVRHDTSPGIHASSEINDPFPQRWRPSLRPLPQDFQESFRFCAEHLCLRLYEFHLQSYN
ncbi:unnamed protein product [Nesidiocoris tenuis]|uniref:Uncharacterized protein n=1 Tax=Nesidiocoris tenuis TaxID=355587 RepID=A0A6H5GB44_9HEMI|nr:unnamed protein product [Nesidiocoris tenuis]